MRLLGLAPNGAKAPVGMKVSDNLGVSPVVGFEPMWTKRDFGFCGFCGYSVAIACLGLLLNSAVGMAMPLFAGITGIEAGQLQADGSQVIRFSADLPFQYQTQALDDDHVVLRLYNARLGQALLTPEGAINVLAGGAVQSARLRSGKSRSTQSQSAQGEASPSPDFQELIFAGAGLGRIKLKIIGGEALPVKVTLPKPKSQPSAAKLASAATSLPAKDSGVVSSSKPSVKRKSSETQMAQSLSNLNTLKKEVRTGKPTADGSGFDKLMGQPVAMMATLAEAPAPPSVPRGPQITSVRRLAGGTPQTIAMPAPPPMVEAAPPAMAVAAEPADVSPPPPEPSYQILTPLPRYQGGAAPIQAMTTDADGNPIIIRPKNQPILEFNTPQAPESFNVLFQSEGSPAQQRVATLMADSLKAYQAKQYAKALPLIQQALQLQSENADLYAALAEIQGQLAQKQEAMKAYARAYQYNPQQYGQPYAQALVLVGQRGKAIEVLKGLYGKDPNQAGLAYMLGTLYEELGQTEKALPYLKQAAELHPGSADIQYNLGLAYELAGDNLLAERHYQRALSLDASAADVQKALARVRAVSRE